MITKASGICLGRCVFLACLFERGPFLRREVFVAARVELPEEHVHHAPVVVHLQLLQKGTPDLQQRNEGTLKQGCEDVLL